MNSSTRKKPFIVGLTGGIGSGKSTVCEFFQQLGVDIIDADIVAREVVMPGTEALSEIAGHFGPDVLDDDGSLDRRALRNIIFNDESERKWLESLLHPLIRQRIQELIAESASSYVILSAPLLLESGHYDFVDRVLVVDVSPETQVRRTVNRDKLDKTAVLKIMASQLDRQARLDRADDVLNNDKDLDTLASQIKYLHEYYEQSSKQPH